MTITTNDPANIPPSVDPELPQPQPPSRVENYEAVPIAVKTAAVGGAVNLACYGVAGNLLNGRIAQALIYNRALSAAEVLENFNASKSRYGL